MARTPNGIPGERERRAAEAPPGSRERAETDVTGWSPERDEPPEVREGRFHRAARLRMAQPRTGEGAPPPGRPAPGDSGPYGRDDRALGFASGVGSGPRMGEQDRSHSLESPHIHRDYRPWDRTGEDHSEPQRQDPGEVGSEQGDRGPVAPPREAPARTHRRGRGKHEPLTARDVMTRHVKSVHPSSGLREVARIMREEDCGIVPVVDERGRLQGVLTDRDLVLRTLAEGRPPDDMRARDILTENVEAVTPDEDIPSLLALMGHRQVRRVPVVERDDRLVGILSLGDIATRADCDEELREALRRISARRPFWSRLD